MKELIEKLEAAPEGSRELDAEIARWAHGDAAYLDQPYSTPMPYTTSLDAAMTLIPEGRTYGVGETRYYTHPLTSETLEPDGKIFGWARVTKDTPIVASGEEFEAEAPTPALALTIAALKARGGR